MYALRERAWRRWQAAAGPWRGWSVCLPLQAPSVEGVTSQPTATAPTAVTIVDNIAVSLNGQRTAVLLDLDPVVGVHVAKELNRRQLANVVLVLPHWPYAEAVLPVEQLLGALITQARRLSAADLPHVVFVLDVRRAQTVRRPSHDVRADNRYRLAASDLPTLAALQRAGIQRILKVAYA